MTSPAEILDLLATTGNLEIKIADRAALEKAKPLIQASYEANRLGARRRGRDEFVHRGARDR